MKYADIKSLVRRLRSNLTTEEEILWHNLRKRQLLGRKFVHQTAIIYENSKDEYFFYVPDFYCHQERLVVELDGKIHDYQKERD